MYVCEERGKGGGGQGEREIKNTYAIKKMLYVHLRKVLTFSAKLQKVCNYSSSINTNHIQKCNGQFLRCILSYYSNIHPI